MVINNNSISTRRGAITLELFVAATLLSAMMGVFAPLTVRTCRIWKESRHQQLALDELSNQLERLQAMSATDRSAAIGQLTLSSVANNALAEARLSATEIRDGEGHRIVIEIDWQRTVISKPLSLVGWIWEQDE